VFFVLWYTGADMKQSFSCRFICPTSNYTVRTLLTVRILMLSPTLKWKFPASGARHERIFLPFCKKFNCRCFLRFLPAPPCSDLGAIRLLFARQVPRLELCFYVLCFMWWCVYFFIDERLSHHNKRLLTYLMIPTNLSGYRSDAFAFYFLAVLQLQGSSVIPVPLVLLQALIEKNGIFTQIFVGFISFCNKISLFS